MDTLDIPIFDGDAYQGRYDAFSTGMDDVLSVSGKGVEVGIGNHIAVSGDG